MSGGRWHVSAVIDGTTVTVDYREPIRAQIDRLRTGRGTDEDREAVLAWHATHAIMSANCARGVCDHVV